MARIIAFLLLVFFVLIGVSVAAGANKKASPQGKENSQHGQKVSKQAKEIKTAVENAAEDTEDENNEEENNEGENGNQDCNAEADWKNHGAYVSCVAHQKQ